MSSNKLLFLCLWPFIGGSLITFFVLDGVLGETLRRVLLLCFAILAPALFVLWNGFRKREKQDLSAASILGDSDDSPGKPS